MIRLNSGIFQIFELNEGFKIIWNDTKLELISWVLKIENPFLAFA